MAEFPSKAALRAWLAENPGAAGRREIARAFGIKGADRAELRRVLRELEEEGAVTRERGGWKDAGRLPPVTVLEVGAPDAAGDLFARPLEGRLAGTAARIMIQPQPGEKAAGPGDRVLARLAETAEPGLYSARVIRRIGIQPRRVLGIFRAAAEGGRIAPVDKGADSEWRVAPGATMGARDGELVEAEETGTRARLGLPAARVIARLGDPGAARSVSLIAIHQHGIPDVFPDEALAEAEAAGPASTEGREDLRHMPFVTIDPADARDHDDAVWAHPDEDARNIGGHVLWVAIADVAAYVRPGTALDREARRRGNSTYFPDRVVPMLPERLSADLCSLVPDTDRPVVAVRLKLDSEGRRLSHRFTRAVIRSRARLAYPQVQAAADGRPDAATAPLTEEVIGPLYAAHAALKRARSRRQPLDLDLPERRIELAPDGRVLSVGFPERLEAHRLIEEAMVAANVAAAEELGRLQRPLLFRVHEEPSPEKIEALRAVAEASGFTLARGQVLMTRHLNALLAQAEGTAFDELMNVTTLRSMTQAYYHPSNFGHFGLALVAYAHFTSPIRRYADLVVHRALIAGHGWGSDGLSPGEVGLLEDTARHISETERRSMAAERDTADRYLAAFLADRVGAILPGRISGVARFGVFVRLDETGADGLIPVRSLGREYFHFDADGQTLMGETTGLTLGLGQRVTVKLVEAVPTTGGLAFELVAVEDRTLPRGPAPKGKAGGGRKAAAERARGRTGRRTAERRRRER
ncbi:MAG: ribonuclease R [Rhodobacteraceae bacterium]|jgi:ribonuclease R|nr:ribonuclease R [Paracoccaceae bacterium]